MMFGTRNVTGRLQLCRIKRYFRFLKFLVAFTLVTVPLPSSAEQNPLLKFFTGDISSAINETVSRINQSIDVNDKSVSALNLLNFCYYSDNISCAEPAFKFFQDGSLIDSTDEETAAWISTELQNALVANSISHPEVRKIFHRNRFEHINYFSHGDGTLANFLNAQKSLAITAIEEGQTVYAREVVSRLVYLLSELPHGQSFKADSAHILANIIEISAQIGDHYTARQFFEIADTYIIENLIFSKPYLYRYLLSSAQLIAASAEKQNQRDAISRISHARSILESARFNEEFKTAERSYLQTNQILIELKLNEFLRARDLYISHPMQEKKSKTRIKKIHHGHELYFYTLGLILKDLGLLDKHELPKISMHIFEREYSWESLQATGDILKFSRFLGLYLHKKLSLNKLEPAQLDLAFNVLLEQIETAASPTSMLYSHPSFFFRPLARYYLLESSRQKYRIDAVKLVKLIDSLNRNSTQIYGDFLASAPPKGETYYFIAHTLFDLSSNRLSVEKSIISGIVLGLSTSSKQQDSLIKINTSIQSLFESNYLKWQKNVGASYIQSDIRDGNAVVFGFEMGGYLNVYCTDGVEIYYSGGYKLNDIKNAADKLKKAINTNEAFLIKWSEFPYRSAYELGKLLYNSQFEKCIKQNTKITVVPFGPLADLPFSVFLSEEYRGQFKTAPWALLSNSFSYATSIKEALNSYFDRHEVKSETFLGIADPSFDPNAQKVRLASIDNTNQRIEFGTRTVVSEKFSALPETEEEIRKISDLFAESTVLSNSLATERNLRGTHLAAFDVLSFATHGALSGEASGIWDPSLILTQEAKSTKRYMSDATNGILTADEISKLNLSASIVSLSACNTAATDLGGSSRNVQSLASAFRLAGVDNVMATLWPVETKAAASLNVTMFENWVLTGRTIAESLRSAQLTYLTSVEETKASPAFWGANIILGAGQSVSTRKQFLEMPFDLMIDNQTGYVSGAAMGEDKTLIISKNLLINEGRLSPSVERKSFENPASNKKLVSREVYGSVVMHESFGRNLMSSISYTENETGEFRTAPMISEYDDLGNFLWNYQYPLEYGTNTILYSLTALPNGSIFALLHSDVDDGQNYSSTSLIGLVLSQKGKFVQENVYYTSSKPLPLNRSLVITPSATSTYFGFILNVSKYGHNGIQKGDLGEVFYCSEPEAFVFWLEYETYEVFASDRINNFWVDSTLDTGDGFYFSGAKAEDCRFNLILGGVPSFGFYKDMNFTTLHEDPSYMPSKITDIATADDTIHFTQIWRPQVGGVRIKAPENFDENFDDLWNLAEPTETEDSVYSFIGVGKWKDNDELGLDFLQLNNFWAEGAKIINESAIFFGKLGSKSAVVSAPLD